MDGRAYRDITQNVTRCASCGQVVKWWSNPPIIREIPRCNDCIKRQQPERIAPVAGRTPRTGIECGDMLDILRFHVIADDTTRHVTDARRVLPAGVYPGQRRRAGRRGDELDSALGGVGVHDLAHVVRRHRIFAAFGEAALQQIQAGAGGRAHERRMGIEHAMRQPGEELPREVHAVAVGLMAKPRRGGMHIHAVAIVRVAGLWRVAGVVADMPAVASGS